MKRHSKNHPNRLKYEAPIKELIAALRLTPETGDIWLGDQRGFLMDSSAISILRSELIETVGIDQARGLLSRVGYLAGARVANWARKFGEGHELKDVFTLGMQLAAVEGFGLVQNLRLELDVAKRHFLNEVICPNLTEAEAHLTHYGVSAVPVCWIATGFACGYASTLFGQPILIREIECRAMGYDSCRFIGKPANKWEGDAQDDFRFLEAEPFVNRHIAGVGQRTSSRSKSSRDSASVVTSRFDDRRLVGISAAFNAACHTINRVASTSAPVLFLGESGVGKELFARMLHEASPRSKEPFVAVNCAAIPEQLIEADLFGVEKGAFTGASTSREGRFERANGGTLLLDEIGCLTLDAQAKLLRVLQEGEVERVGGLKARRIDVRVVGATNEDLATAINSGKFREDLYYRINVFPIYVPALRERKADIPILANYFLDRYSSLHHHQVTGYSEAALAALLDYEWPGNIRELENVVERAVILASDGEAIGLAHLPPFSHPKRQLRGRSRGEATEALGPVKPLAHASSPTPGKTLAECSELPTGVIEPEQSDKIRAAIQRNQGNLAAAARELGITRPQLTYRAKRLGLQELFRRNTRMIQ